MSAGNRQLEVGIIVGAALGLMIIAAAALVFVRRRRGGRGRGRKPQSLHEYLSEALYTEVEDSSKAVEFSTSNRGGAKTAGQYAAPLVPTGAGEEDVMHGVAASDYNEL